MEEIISMGLDTLIEDIIQASRNAGQEASGRTYQKITKTVSRTGDIIKGEVWAPSYFYTLIRGRGPGKVPYSDSDSNENMLDIIMEWARHKGISFSDDKELLRFARAAAWKIRREGTEIYRNHLYLDITETPIRIFEEYLDGHLDEFMDKLITRSLGDENFSGHGYII